MCGYMQKSNNAVSLQGLIAHSILYGLALAPFATAAVVGSPSLYETRRRGSTEEY